MKDLFFTPYPFRVVQRTALTEYHPYAIELRNQLSGEWLPFRDFSLWTSPTDASFHFDFKAWRFELRFLSQLVAEMYASRKRYEYMQRDAWARDNTNVVVSHVPDLDAPALTLEELAERE